MYINKMLHYVWVLGIKGRTGQSSVLALSKVVERASKQLWLCHKDKTRKPFQTSSGWSTLLPRHHKGVQRHGPNQASKYFFTATRPAISDREESTCPAGRVMQKITRPGSLLTNASGWVDFSKLGAKHLYNWWVLGWGCVWLVVTTVLLNIA